ncbi:MAG: PaaI family thioesterase [Acidimicrobiales bacterium]
MSDEAHRRLAEALRGLLGDLHETVVSTDDADRLTLAVERFRSDLEAPRRSAWYDDDPSLSDEARRSGWRDWSLFRGEHQALAPPLRLERASDDSGPHIVGRVTCGRMYEGPPGAVHGGYLAGLFDDMLGACLSLVDGPSGVTGRLTVRYRRPTPVETPLEFEARPVDVRARRFVAAATCRVADTITAEAEALFVRRPL